MEEGKHHKLTIWLLKNLYQNAEDYITQEGRPKGITISDGNNDIGTIFIKRPLSKQPGWASFFEDVFDTSKFGTTKHVSAVLITKASNRFFALTFGHGRYLLKTGCWEERFGLKVALNSLGKQNIRALDKKTFDSIDRQSKEQASKESSIDEFGLDIEQDLLRGVVGVPKDRWLGSIMSGKESLSISTKMKIIQLGDLLDTLFDKYQEDSYKTEFPWVDYIQSIKDKSLTTKLDNKLVHEISGGSSDKIWMTIPEIVNWGQVQGFCYNKPATSPRTQNIGLVDFLKSLTEDEVDEINVEILKKKKIYCMDSEGNQLYRWPAYKCIYCEATIGGNTYLLSDGKWYAVDTDFAIKVQQSFEAIPDYQNTLPEYNDESEKDYNERVAANFPSQYTLLDRNLVYYGGGRSSIEIADLYSSERDFIHVKHYGGSSVLSHLFSQGKISGELFQMEAEFRAKVNEELPKSFKLENTTSRPETRKYGVVYAIIRDTEDDLDLPFFSKLNIKNSVRTLEGLGFRVAKAKIDVADKRKKLRKIPSK